jgi:hypothetical protein
MNSLVSVEVGELPTAQYCYIYDLPVRLFVWRVTPCVPHSAVRMNVRINVAMTTSGYDFNVAMTRVLCCYDNSYVAMTTFAARRYRVGLGALVKHLLPPSKAVSVMAPEGWHQFFTRRCCFRVAAFVLSSLLFGLANSHS